MEYEFFIDEKVSIWRRNIYKVEANTKEEALKIIEKEFNEMFLDETVFESSEFIYDTEEYLLPNENNNCATRELIEIDTDNREKTIKTNI